MLRQCCSALLALFAAACLAACGSPASRPQPLVVLAAASLQEALNAEADAWAAQGHPRPTLSFAGSSALARQIDSGAPADLFLSADEEWMDQLDKAGLLRPRTRADLLTNSLVLIRNPGSAVGRLSELGFEKLALADPAAVPAGRYAKAALQNLDQWPGVEHQVVPAENVRAALALVESGEAALGIVYATDARASGKVEVLQTFPESSHPPIRYPVAVLAASTNPQAEPFARFLASPQGRAIFARYGFGSAK
jgi:molybdate transport system substrate-binding protein